MDIDVMAELAATVGDLACGCPFDRDGLHHLGEWVQCPYHRAPTPVISRQTVVPATPFSAADPSPPKPLRPADVAGPPRLAPRHHHQKEPAMLTALAPSPASPRMFGLHDYRRSYVLPAGVNSNIPRTGSVGEFGAWNHARGVLVEVSRRLGATPVALHYHELDIGPARLPGGIEVTAVARAEDGELVTVVSRREDAPYGPRGDYWQFAVNGVVPADGIASSPPSLPWLAHLVRLALRP